MWVEQLDHREIQLLPAIKQHETDRPVEIGERGKRVAFKDGDEVVQPGLGECLLRRGDLVGAELGSHHTAATVVAHRGSQMQRRNTKGNTEFHNRRGTSRSYQRVQQSAGFWRYRDEER